MSISIAINQALALSIINVKSFPHRINNYLVSIISIACVAAVILTVLTMTQGMIKTLAQSGHHNTLLVMRSGAVSELQSVMFPSEVNLLANHQQILRDKDNRPLYSAEMFVNAELSSQSNEHVPAKIEKLALRGISENTFYFRPDFKIVSGKKFKTGIRQLIIGQAISRRMPELMVGKTIKLGGTKWLISGVFSDNNSVFESEIWADLGMVQSDYQRGNSIQSLRLAIKEGTDIANLNQEWQIDPRLNVRTELEQVFFANQGENLTRLIRWVGFPVAIIMALGAIIAALNTMYSAIASRSKEIATHKAIGFSPFAILFSIISEALLIALIATMLAITPLYILFDGWTASTQNAATLSQLMFNFDISFTLICQTIALSSLIGFLGGLLPAIKAMTLPITVAIRD